MTLAPQVTGSGSEAVPARNSPRIISSLKAAQHAKGEIGERTDAPVNHRVVVTTSYLAGFTPDPGTEFGNYLSPSTRHRLRAEGKNLSDPNRRRIDRQTKTELCNQNARACLAR
jgi:hypothetical protein